MVRKLFRDEGEPVETYNAPGSSPKNIEPHPTGPEGVSSLAVFVVTVVLFLLAGLLSGGSATVAVLIGDGLSLIYIVYLFSKINWNWDNVFGKHENAKGHIKELLLLLVLMFLFAWTIRLLALILYSYVAPGLFHSALGRNEIVNSSVGGRLWAGLNAGSLIVLTPFIEEILFRGFILRGLVFKARLKWGFALAVLLFAILHGSDFFPIVPFAVVLGYLYLKYKTLLLPIIFHALNNTIAVVLGSLSKGSNSSLTSQDITNLQAGLPVYLAVFLVIGFFFIRYLYKRWPKDDENLLNFEN